jgi:hypothetical protein
MVVEPSDVKFGRLSSEDRRNFKIWVRPDSARPLVFTRLVLALATSGLRRNLSRQDLETKDPRICLVPRFRFPNKVRVIEGWLMEFYSIVRWRLKLWEEGVSHPSASFLSVLAWDNPKTNTNASTPEQVGANGHSTEHIPRNRILPTGRELRKLRNSITSLTDSTDLVGR